MGLTRHCLYVLLSKRSSLSQWVHACDALELPAQQREHLDSFIDQLYKDIEKGHILSQCCSIFYNKFFLSQLSRFATAELSEFCLYMCVLTNAVVVT